MISGENGGRHHRRDRRTVPTQLAAMAAGVTEATIRKWASRGKITRYGSPGRAEYDIDELIRLAAARSGEGVLTGEGDGEDEGGGGVEEVDGWGSGEG
jgi:hypothetical protein